MRLSDFVKDTDAASLAEARLVAGRHAEELRVAMEKLIAARTAALQGGSDAEVDAIEAKMAAAGRALDRADAILAAIDEMLDQAAAKEAAQDAAGGVTASKKFYERHLARRIAAANAIDEALAALAKGWSDYADAGDALLTIERIGAVEISPPFSEMKSRSPLIAAVKAASESLWAVFTLPEVPRAATRPLAEQQAEFWQNFASCIQREADRTERGA